MIEGTGRAWYDNYWSPPRIGIGDLSWGNKDTQEFGGPWDHACHQNGLEVDIRYVRNDTLELPLNLGDTTQIQYYDLAGTIALIVWLFQNSNSNKIIISPYSNLDLSDLDVDTVVYDSNGWHDNHFHLRIEDPDGTGN